MKSLLILDFSERLRQQQRIFKFLLFAFVTYPNLQKYFLFGRFFSSSKSCTSITDGFLAILCTRELSFLLSFFSFLIPLFSFSLSSFLTSFLSFPHLFRVNFCLSVSLLPSLYLKSSHSVSLFFESCFALRMKTFLCFFFLFLLLFCCSVMQRFILVCSTKPSIFSPIFEGR